MLRTIKLDTPHGSLFGSLLPEAAPQGLVLLVRAHHAPVDDLIAGQFADSGYSVLRMELLTRQEMQFADATQNVPRLAQRLLDVLDLIRHDGDMSLLSLALQAHGDTTPAAIRVAAQRDAQVKALACHGGIVDRAGLQALEWLAAPLLMQFDGDDAAGQAAWQRARPRLRCQAESQILAPGDDAVAGTTRWFKQHL